MVPALYSHTTHGKFNELDIVEEFLKSFKNLFQCLWILVHFGNSVECLIVGRFLSGISSGGMYIVHSMFISEISDAR